MEEKKEFVISIRMNESMLKTLKRQADAERRSLSNYIYLLLLDSCTAQGDIVQPLFIK